jgi:hypothetical protein
MNDTIKKLLFCAIILAALFPILYGVSMICSCSESTQNFDVVKYENLIVITYSGKNYTCTIDTIPYLMSDLYYNPCKKSECCLTQHGDSGLGVFIIVLDIVLTIILALSLGHCMFKNRSVRMRIHPSIVILQARAQARTQSHNPTNQQQLELTPPNDIPIGTVQISENSTVIIAKKQDEDNQSVIIVQPCSKSTLTLESEHCSQK